MKIDSRPTRRSNVLTQETSDALVLLDPNGGAYFSLNEVGSRVWHLCDGTRTVADVVGVLADEFDAPSETIREDVLELLEELAAERLVSESP
jgi:pyrroloquinoline quinone biosynthesis protein D